MTSSVTRSSRSSNKKLSSNTTDSKVVKSTASKKKKQSTQSKKDTDLENRSKKHLQQQQESEEEDLPLSTEHPEYKKLMAQLDQSYNERIQRIEATRNFDRQAILYWFDAQKKQAYDEFHFARMKVRSDIVQNLQRKITRLKQEIAFLNKQSRVQYTQQDQYQDWVPPDRPYTIGSFVGGATNEEIDRDLLQAKQPYNGTPHLIYSDYTTDTAESPSKSENASSTSTMSDPLPPISHSNYTTNHNNISYPPYELPQNGNDWWPYNTTSTTTA